MLEMRVQSIVSLPVGNGNPLQVFADNAYRQKCLAGYSPQGHEKAEHNWTTKQQVQHNKNHT